MTRKVNGSYSIHLVSTWAFENNLVLGQIKVEENSNEITATLDLSDALDISETMITIDAMGTQKEKSGMR